MGPKQHQGALDIRVIFDPHDVICPSCIAEASRNAGTIPVLKVSFCFFVQLVTSTMENRDSLHTDPPSVLSRPLL
jgi:hypothetical protein